ncbi:MAG: DUF6288 domain-containing protein [Planctomycetaceae bacterium]
MLRAAALLALALLARAEGWPFGGEGMLGRRDLYNLGPLGLKASDADGPPPDPSGPPQGRRSVRIDPGAGDDYPARLKVELLFPDGPAAQAGLAPGDILTGAEGARFQDGVADAVAKVILRAQAGKGLVTLPVVPAAGGEPRKVRVTIPALGKEALDPTRGGARGRAVEEALAWLAGKQLETGGFAETLSGHNGAVVLTAMAGLAWSGAGGGLSKGPYGENLRRPAAFLCESVKTLSGGTAAQKAQGAVLNQCNWGCEHAGLFLGELQAHTPDDAVKEARFFCGRRLLETQESSGGWAHGPGGPNPLGYVELNIVPGLALGALGMAKQAGIEVAPQALERAIAYLKASGGDDGGVGYSTEPGQKGIGNIGRTAAAWLAQECLGLGREAGAKKAGKHVEAHASEMFGGHASLMQHFLLAGVAAQTLGGEARKRYWSVAQRELLLARAPDGSFQPRPWHESLAMQSNSDVSFGEVWTTAAWTVVLLADAGPKDAHRGFPAWTGHPGR